MEGLNLEACSDASSLIDARKLRDSDNKSASSNQSFTPNLWEMNSIKVGTQGQLSLLLIKTLFQKDQRHTTASKKRLSILSNPYP